MKIEEAVDTITTHITKLREHSARYPGNRSGYGIRFIRLTACLDGDETGNEPGTLTIEGKTIDPRIIEAWITSVYLPAAASSGNGGPWWTTTVDRLLWVDILPNRIKLRVASDPSKDTFIPGTLWQ